MIWTRSQIAAIVVCCAAISICSAQTPDTWPTKRWPTTTPRAAGFDPKALADFDAEIAAGKYGNVDSFLVIRNGKLAFERSYKRNYDQIYGEQARKPGPLNPHDPSGPYNYFNPWWHPFYRRGDLHTMQSASKTVTSVAIGTAIAHNEFPELDTPILKFFDEGKVAHLDDRKRRIALRHLLTMTAGFDWNENLPYNDPNNAASLMEASADWIQFVIDRPMAADPGTVFNYNSGVTELLSYIFRKATGKDLEEYAARNLFAPLGMDYYWKRSPSGLVDTEGGLYLKPQDLAKIGYLFLHGGMWDGKQIVPAAWVKASVLPSAGVSSNGVKYGFQWWLYPYGDDSSHVAWAASGFGGQAMIVLPEYDIIIAYTGWNILDGQPRLAYRVAIDRVLGAISRSQRDHR